ncbi:MAG: Ig-like domain-containing protein, partial [Muribaculaceae bacterium]|nr:Ig-like domain-containing protein [Muribaculaceae bacterium]
VVKTPVTSVSLGEDTLSLTEGENATLTATVAPENATFKDVTWTSDNEAVATVKDGVVTAVAAGSATITATADGQSATCTVTVAAKVIAVTGVTLNQETLSLTEGENATLTATVAPVNATDKDVTWTSDNEDVATVENGVVTAVKAGTANITAAAGGKSATCAVTVVAPAPETVSTVVPVKMTYVNMSDPDTAYGEIAAGETAMSGYNSISSGTVGFGNTGWGVNYITYLQVNVSEIEGTILSAKLTFDASGSTDGKRTTTWGAGYNSSEWSSEMTYNSADKTITQVGETASTSEKSSGTFKNLSIDITDAVLNVNEDGLITVLLYETAAAGGYVKNPVVTVEWSKQPTYQVTFKETNGVDATVVVKKRDVTAGTSLIDGTYTFSATAKGYKNYSGTFTVAGADQEVKFSMTPKDIWHWTLVSNLGTEIDAGTCFEGESATAAYPRYILDNGTVWMKAPCGGDKKLEYNYTFTPEYDNQEVFWAYSEMASDGIYFIEGEDIEGMESTANGNAGVRASNSKGGFASDPVEFYTIEPGKYVISIAASGTGGKVLTVKGGEETLFTATTTGSWNEFKSDTITIESETVLTFEGAADGYPLDYILITGKVAVPATSITLNKNEINVLIGKSETLVATVEPDNTTQSVVWKSDNEDVATVSDKGVVTAVKAGKATITATC